MLTIDEVEAGTAFLRNCTKLDLHDGDLEQGLGDFLLFALGAVINAIADVLGL